MQNTVEQVRVSRATYTLNSRADILADYPVATDPQTAAGGVRLRRRG